MKSICCNASVNLRKVRNSKRFESFCSKCKKTCKAIERKMFQVVYIEVEGETYTFTGKAMPHKTGVIDSIRFSEPRELPDDCNFAELNIT